MRGYSLNSDMDFRVIPSAIPLQSPSPDKKSINMITPTISPNTIDIKKNSTPIRSIWQQKQSKNIQEVETEAKFYSHSPKMEYSNMLKQKDDIIKNLKSIIDMITENSRQKKPTDDQQQQLKTQVKILTIENQKLVNIIDKLSRNKNIDENTVKLNQEYEHKIDELTKTMKQNQFYHEEETKQLKKLNKSLNTHCKSLEAEKKELQLENKKLMKILKQKNQAEKKLSEPLKLSDASEISNDDKSHTSKNQDRLTLMKIRQQHSENLKMLKQGLIKEIEETFDTMKIALQGINGKVISLSKRLESVEAIVWAKVTKSQIETENIKISIKENIISSEENPKTDRSYNIEQLQKKSNSEIYIQQGQSSSHERVSRNEFSRMEEIPSQKNLHRQLQQELASVKQQLSEIRFKYDKMCLDTDSVSYSQRKAANEFMELQEKYKQAVMDLSTKDKQIALLYDQIRSIEEEHLGEVQKKQQYIREKIMQIQKIKEIQQQEIAELQNETQLKVKLLIDTYEKQNDMLRKQIQSKNSTLQQTSEAVFIHKSESNRKIQDLSERVVSLQAEKNQLLRIIKDTEISFSDQKQTWNQEKNNLQAQLTVAKQSELEVRAKKEQIQQQLVLQISQISQQKSQIEELKNQLSQKYNLVQDLTSTSRELLQKYQKMQVAFAILQQMLSDKQNEIVKMRKQIVQWSETSILQKIEQLQRILISNNDQNKQTLAAFDLQLNNGSEESQTSKLRKQNFQLVLNLQSIRQQLLILKQRNSNLQDQLKLAKSQSAQQAQSYRVLLDKLNVVEGQLTLSSAFIQKHMKSTEISTYQAVTNRVIGLKQIEQARTINMRALLEERAKQSQ